MIINFKQFSKHIQRFSQGIFLIPFSRDFLVQKCVDENGRKADIQVCIINLGEAVQNFFGVYEGLNLYISDGYNAVFYRNPSENNIDFTFISSSDVVSSENISSVESINNNFIINPNSFLEIKKESQNQVSNNPFVPVFIPYGFSEIDIFGSIENYHFYSTFTEKHENSIIDFRINDGNMEWKWKGFSDENSFLCSSVEKLRSIKINVILHDVFNIRDFTLCSFYKNKTTIKTDEYWENPTPESTTYSTQDDFYFVLNNNPKIFNELKNEKISDSKQEQFDEHFPYTIKNINANNAIVEIFCDYVLSIYDGNLKNWQNENIVKSYKIENAFYFFFIKDRN